MLGVQGSAGFAVSHSSFTALALTGPDNLLNAAEFIRVMDPEGAGASFMRWDIEANLCAWASGAEERAARTRTQTEGERSML